MRRLSNWLDSYMEYTHKNESPSNFHYWTALWALSAAIERKAWLDFGYFTIYPNLFVILTGPPASHKGTAAGIANKIVTKVEGINIGPDVTSIQSLIYDLGEVKKGEGTQAHCSMALLSTEWSTFLGDRDRYLCNMMCKLYDCDERFKKGTKTQGTDRLQNVYLTMLACSTAKQIGDCLPHSAIGGGFTSRCIFVVEDEAKHKRNPRPRLTQHEKHLKECLIHDLQHIHNTLTGSFSFTYGGGEFFDDWYINRKEMLEIDEKFHHYCDRKPIHVESVAMLLSAARGDSMRIGAGEIADSIQLLDSIEPRMPEALGGVGLSSTSPVISMIVALLRKNKKLTTRQLQGYLIRDADKDELKLALETIQGSTLPIDANANGEWVWGGGR